MRRLIACYLFFILSMAVNAQKEASHWYFGNGVALDFNYGYAKAVNDGQLYTSEGCGTISDNKGRLLFYSDGITVWNSDHLEMANGTGLGGAASSTQSCIILQKPGSEYLYYVFTADELAGPKGLEYSVVDMSLNDGLGAVTVKNQALLSPISEKLTAIRNKNGKGWWVLVHQWNSDVFFCYPFDASGVGTPVVSKSGSVHKDVGSKNKSESIGYMKSSPNGRKIAEAICYIPGNNIEVFDFDNVSGQVSNPMYLPSPGNAYGVCFSPDNSKLYVSYQAGGAGVVQYDLGARDVVKSAERVSKVDSTRYGALQLGPDGKIYMAKLGQFLDAITNPNGEGKACGFKRNYVNLKGMYSTFGLPDFFVLKTSNLKLSLGNDTVVCDKNLILDAGNKGATYVWSTGQKEQRITVSKNGTYWVTVSENAESVSDTIHVKFRKQIRLDLGKDTTVCGGIYPLDGGNSGLSYRWSTGVSTQVCVATTSGTYAVTVSDGICVKSDSVKVTFLSPGDPVVPVKEFQPNNGGLNDHFDYILNNVYAFTVRIKTKRGKLLFETNSMRKRWDGNFEGKEVSKGDYNWEIQYKSTCTRDKIITIRGVVKIL
jgi:gliding motility-associated-like protein